MKTKIFAMGVMLAAISANVGPAIAGCPTKGVKELTGAGATFPYPLYSKWFYEYSNANPGVRFNYQSIGSGGGIKQITAGTVNFGATDAPMTEESMKKLPGAILHVPTALGAVVPVYNLDGVPAGLKLTPDVLAGIFLGFRVPKGAKTTNWAAPRLSAQQITYAATDAWTCRELYLRFDELGML